MAKPSPTEVSVERFEVLLAKMYACRSESSALAISDKLTILRNSMPEKEEVLAQLALQMYLKLKQLNRDQNEEDFILTEIKGWHLYWLLTRQMQLAVKGEAEMPEIKDTTDTAEEEKPDSLHFGKAVLGAVIASSAVSLAKLAFKKHSVEVPSEVPK